MSTPLDLEELNGWRFAPEEPTREMWAAMGDAIVATLGLHHDKIASALWSAVFNALPAPATSSTDRAREALVKDWRDRAEDWRESARDPEAPGFEYAIGKTQAYSACADDLAAALSAPTPGEVNKALVALREINRVASPDGSRTMDDMMQALVWITAHARAALAQAEVNKALSDIAAERRRQVEVEGWTPEHDDQHDDFQMARAARGYILRATRAAHDQRYGTGCPPPCWPWSPSWWKPKDRRRDLVRAGALIVAEIERLDRAALSQAEGERHG